MLVDYHLHTVFSRHAVGTVDQYVSRAEELGIEEVCFTEHISRQYMTEEIQNRLAEPWMREHELPDYFELLRAAAAKTSISVLWGLEADYIDTCEEALRDLLESLPLDFVLGTIHFLPAYEMRYLSDIEDEPAVFLLNYFSYAKQAVESGLFDSIAHLNLGWHTVPWPKGKDEIKVEEALAEVVSATRAQDMCLEINTRAFNFEGFGTPEAYHRFLRLIADYDVSVTLGSDAHRPEEVGRNYSEALRYLNHYGINQVATFRKRRRDMVSINARLRSAAQGHAPSSGQSYSR